MANMITSRITARNALIPDPEIVAAVAHELPGVVAEANRRYLYALTSGTEPIYLAGQTRFMLTLIRTRRASLDPADYAAAVAALCVPEVFAIMLALADTSDAAAAQRFWGDLACSVPSPDHVGALVLLGVAAHRRGELRMAEAAASEALLADPTQIVASALLEVLARRDPTDRLRALGSEGHRLATELGVQLPALVV